MPFLPPTDGLGRVARHVLPVPVELRPLDREDAMSATRVSVPGRAVLLIDHGPSSATTGDVEGASRIAPVHDQPVKDRVLPPIPRTGLVALTSKGLLHRVQVDGAMHARCRGGRTVAHRVISEDEARSLAANASERLCRYRWCFRDDVEALGIDPWVGHVARIRRRIA